MKWSRVKRSPAFSEKPGFCTVAEFARIQGYPTQQLNSCEFSYTKWE